MKEIIFENQILARLIHLSEISDELYFCSKNEESIQVGIWKYNKSKELKRHIHNDVPRRIRRTQEVLVVISGKIEATIYDLKQNEVEKLEVSAGDVLILLDSGHGYKIISDDTQVVEIKNGPYKGAEIDRLRF